MNIGQKFKMIVHFYMEVYAVRHAQSTYNLWRVQRVFKPSLWFVKDPMYYDSPLTEKGLSQACQASFSVKEVASELDLILCSPLTRTIQTMQGMFPNPKCRVVLTPLIREQLKHACDIGKPYSELSQSYPEYEFQHFEKEHWWQPKTSDPWEVHRESWDELLERVNQTMLFLKQHREKKVFLVTHGNFLRAFLNVTFLPRNCQVTKLSF